MRMRKIGHDCMRSGAFHTYEDRICSQSSHGWQLIVQESIAPAEIAVVQETTWWPVLLNRPSLHTPNSGCADSFVDGLIFVLRLQCGRTSFVLQDGPVADLHFQLSLLLLVGVCSASFPLLAHKCTGMLLPQYFCPAQRLCPAVLRSTVIMLPAV